MARVEKSIEIDRPLRVAYDQWTQFEEFPRFMEGVEEVHQLSDRHLHWADRCRVTLALEYDPQGVVEKVGDALGFVSRRVEGDLERFKRFVEERGEETGAWRGRISPSGDVSHDPR